MRLCVNDLDMMGIDKLMRMFYLRGDSVNLDRKWDHKQQRYLNMITISAIEINRGKEVMCQYE